MLSNGSITQLLGDVTAFGMEDAMETIIGLTIKKLALGAVHKLDLILVCIFLNLGIKFFKKGEIQILIWYISKWVCFGIYWYW